MTGGAALVLVPRLRVLVVATAVVAEADGDDGVEAMDGRLTG